MKKKNMIAISAAAAALAGAVLCGCGSKQYTVTFSGIEGQNQIKVDWGGVPALPANPTKEGFTFIGWFKDAALTVPYDNSGIESDTILYAGWATNSYSIRYVTNYEGLSFEPKTVAFGATVVVPEENKVVRPYYSFGGWYLDEALTKKVTANTKMGAGDIVLYAKWDQHQLTINFDGNGATYGNMINVTFKETDEHKVLPKCSFTKEGKNFLGWSTVKDGPVEYANGIDLEHLSINGEVTLYAVWETKKVSVEYLSLTASGNITSYKTGEKQDYGTPVNSSSIQAPSVIGLEFKGWGKLVKTNDELINHAKVYYNANGVYYSGADMIENLYEVVQVEEETAKDDTKLYAIFERKQTTMSLFIIEEGKDPVLADSVEGYYGFAGELNFDREIGYDYSGIKANSDFTGADIKSFVFGAENLNFYVKKTHHAYTFSYSGDVAGSRTYFYGDKIESISKTGFIFKGWKIGGADPVIEPSMPDHNVEAIPVFEAKEYKIVLHNIAGESEISGLHYNDALNLGQAPNKTGYSFKGWFYDDEFKTQVEDNAKMRDYESGQVDIYAKYEANKYPLTFDLNGGADPESVAGPLSIDYASLIKDATLPDGSKLVKAGYAFGGWTRSDGSEIGNLAMGTDGLILKAKWIAQDVNVTIKYFVKNLDKQSYTEVTEEAKVVSAKAGSSYDALNDIKVIEHFSYEKREDVESVAGEGTSVANIYYTRDEYQITFKCTGYEDVVRMVQYDDVVANVPAFAKDGYTTQYSVSDIASRHIEENLVVTVTQVANDYNLTFHKNDGSEVEPIVESFKTDADITLTSRFERTGYDFLGWAESETGEVISSKKMPAHATDLYAKWEKHQFDVSIVDSEEEITASEFKVAYQDGISTDKFAAFNKTGYSVVFKVGDDVIDPINYKVESDVEIKAYYTANVHGVTFHGEGGTYNSSLNFNSEQSFGSEVSFNVAFTRSGYTLVGWADEEGGEKKHELTDTFTMGDDAADFYAVWEANEYTLTIVDEVLGQHTVKADFDTIPEFPKLEAEGYTFEGFYDASNNKIDVTTYKMKVGGETLTAKWTTHKVTISFHAAEHMTGSMDQQVIKFGDESMLINENGFTIEDGYSFVGWATEENGEVVYEDKAELAPTFESANEEIDLYAVVEANEYEISFASSVAGSLTPVKARYGDKVDLPDLSVEGYEFKGYKTASGTLLADHHNYVMPLNGVTLTPYFEEYTNVITFNGNGATSGSMSAQTIKYTDTSKALNDCAFAKEGYVFVGWSETEDGDIIDDSLVATFSKVGNAITLYAQWEKGEFTISFDLNGGVGSINPITGKYGDLVDAPNAPEKPGYVFAGWYDADNNRQYVEYIPSGDVTLTAKWEKATYEVSFNSAGGSSIESIELKHEETLTADKLENVIPARTGYTFEGWFLTDKNGELTDEVISKDGEIVKNITINANDVKLTAKWEKITHTVTYHTAGGSVISTATYSYGDSIVKPADPEGAAGETFIGWVTEKDGNNFFDFATDIMKDQEINLYACYVDKNFDIIFKNEAGETIFTISSDAEDATFKAYIQKLLNEKTGYELIDAAIQEAAQYVATEGVLGSQNAITAMIVYATVGENPRYAAITQAGGTAQQYQELSAGFAAYGTPEAKNTILTIAYLAQNDPSTLQGLIPGYMGDSNPLVSGLATAIAGGNTDIITAYALFAMDDQTALDTIIRTVAKDTSDESLAKVHSLVELLPYAENKEYYQLLAENGAKGIENSASITSGLLESVSTIYSQYEANAYNPVSSDPNKVFDGWTESIALDGSSKTMTPVFAEKATPVSNISVYSTGNSSVTFSWESDPKAYGYRVTIYKNGTKIETNIVKNTGEPEMFYKVNGLLRNDEVKIEIVALAKDANGDYRELSQQFTATSLVDGSTLVKTAESLDSASKDITYVHTSENEIGKVTKVGDYYYVTEDGDYILFSNTTYSFGKDTTLAVTSGNDIASVNDAGSLVIGNKTGNIEFTATKGTEVKTLKGIVRAIPQTIQSTSAFENATLSESKFATNGYTYNAQENKFIGERETYKVGLATETAVSGASYNSEKDKLYNGFRFNVENISVSGTPVDMDYDFLFEKKTDGGYEAVDDTFKYTLTAGNTFYFDKDNAKGEYRVTISAKADDKDTGYINSFIPNKYKENDSKMEGFTKLIDFELVDGVNVYNAADLKAAYADKTVKVINIQNDIKAEYAPSGIAYMPYVPNVRGITKLKGSIDVGDCDIVDGTAVMTTDTTYGPAIWVESTTNVVFHDVDGKGYRFEAGNKDGVVIKTAKFTQNFESGMFKIISEEGNSTNLAAMKAKGYKPASPFSRSGEGFVPVEVNGNYFTIDGSSLLKIKGIDKVAVADVAAPYEIQSLHVSIFENTSDNAVSLNCMNIVGNTANESGVSDSKTDAREMMRLTSGGISGIYSTPYGSSQANNAAHLNQVNIYNTLIGIYVDANATVNNCHVNNSWANGIYGWATTEQSLDVKNSLIENSGGCAIDIDNNNTTSTILPVPKVHIDFTTTRVENFVSGDEQWFKAYSMETIALGLKSIIESQVSAMKYTILQDKVNPVTGLTSHCMNWVFFEKSDAVDTNKEGIDKSTIGDEMHFGDDLVYYMQDPSTGVHVYIDPTTQMPKIGILDISGTVFEKTPGVSHPTVGMNAVGNQTVIIEFENGQPTRKYLLFRQEDKTIGFIQGMVELFPKN